MRAAKVAPPASSTGTNARRCEPPAAPPPRDQQRAGDDACREADDALELEKPVREIVVADDLDHVRRAARADLHVRVREHQPRDLDDRDEREPDAHDQAVERALEPTGPERQDEIDEAGEVHDLEEVAHREEHRLVRVLEDAHEPQKPGEDHDRPDPVLRPRPPRQQPTADERAGRAGEDRALVPASGGW
jgi:hypothetical protein